MTSIFFFGGSPVSKNFNLSSTWFFKNSPNVATGISEKQSILDAKEHLLARYRLILPLFFAEALPINVEWNSNPYLGVLPNINIKIAQNRSEANHSSSPLVFRALNSAFSAPKICTVEAGYFAKLVRLPAWEISLAPTWDYKESFTSETSRIFFALTSTCSPISEERLGAHECIFSFRYDCNSFLYSAKAATREANRSIFIKSIGLISIPIELRDASRHSWALASSSRISEKDNNYR